MTDISPYIASDKADLFNVWLANNRDISACLLVMRRRQVKRTKFARQWHYLKKRDLKTMHGGDMEKVNKVVELRKKDGRFVKDELFPDDEEETRWWVQATIKYSDEDIAEQEEEVNVKSDIRPEDAMELGGANGLFAMPPTAGMPEDAAKEFHAALNAWPKAKARGKKQPPGMSSEHVAVTTCLEKLFSLQERCKKDIEFMDRVAPGFTFIARDACVSEPAVVLCVA